MAGVAGEPPSVCERMHELMLRRLARFCWVSRLALEDRDIAVDRRAPDEHRAADEAVSVGRGGWARRTGQGARCPMGQRAERALRQRGIVAGRGPAPGLRLPRHARQRDPAAAVVFDVTAWGPNGRQSDFRDARGFADSHSCSGDHRRRPSAPTKPRTLRWAAARSNASGSNGSAGEGLAHSSHSA